MVQVVWRLLEKIQASVLDDGCCYSYDISLPLRDYYRVFEVMRQRLKDVTTRVVAYGHVGDGPCLLCCFVSLTSLVFGYGRQLTT